MRHETQQLIARLRFRHLSLITELKRSGSLRAAAQTLNLTQPALSKALSEMEGAFGFALFTRNARGLLPTQQGESVIRGAALMLQELAHTHDEATALPGASTRIRLGAPPFLAQGLLPGVLARLLKSQPSVRVVLQEERVPLLLDMLAQGSLDALVTTYPLERPAANGMALTYEKLFEAEFAVIAPPGHRHGRARSVDWQQLAQERWVMPAAISMLRRLLDESFMRAGIVPPLPVVESTSPITNIRLVAAGVGHGAVPADLLRLASVAGQVQRVRVMPALTAGPVALIFRAGALNPRVAIVRDALRAAALARPGSSHRP